MKWSRTLYGCALQAINFLFPHCMGCLLRAAHCLTIFPIIIIKPSQLSYNHLLCFDAHYPVNRLWTALIRQPMKWISGTLLCSLLKFYGLTQVSNCKIAQPGYSFLPLVLGHLQLHVLTWLASHWPRYCLALFVWSIETTCLYCFTLYPNAGTYWPIQILPVVMLCFAGDLSPRQRDRPPATTDPMANHIPVTLS